jgi:hypothetical protein
VLEQSKLLMFEELNIDQLKAVKMFIEKQNTLFDLKLQELESRPNEFMEVMFTGPQKQIIKDIIIQNKEILENIKNLIIDKI